MDLYGVGSSGWIRTSNPPVNSVTQVFGLAVLRGFSSGQHVVLYGGRHEIVRRLFTGSRGRDMGSGWGIVPRVEDVQHHGSRPHAGKQSIEEL